MMSHPLIDKAFEDLVMQEAIDASALYGKICVCLAELDGGGYAYLFASREQKARKLELDQVRYHAAFRTGKSLEESKAEAFEIAGHLAKWYMSSGIPSVTVPVYVQRGQLLTLAAEAGK